MSWHSAPMRLWCCVKAKKAADAAAELMPDYVATCWPNGSNSWHKADLMPLKGRTVVLWPDNDASGTACMDAIELKLIELGAASVQRISLDVFKLKPSSKGGNPTLIKGGKWVEGDDAADALAKGWTTGHVAELVRGGELFESVTETTEPQQPKAKAPAKRPAKSKNDLLPGGFRLTPEGVFYSGDDGEARPVCSPLEIIARTRDDKGHNWGLLVEFDDPDGAKKRWNIPARTMTGDFGKDVLGPLVDMGLRLAGSRSGRNARNDLQSYLGGFDSAQRARLVTRLGWHDKAFLLPEQQIGSHAEHLHFYEAGAQLPPISEAGSLEQWQQQIGALCVGNHRLAFVVSVAFAGPLLNLLGHESGGFHLYGDSSGARPLTCKSLRRFMAGRAWCVRGAPRITPWSPSPLRTQTVSWCWMKSACVTHALLARRCTCSATAPVRPEQMIEDKRADRYRSGVCCFSRPARRHWRSTWRMPTRS